ncbi:hypothetical protein M406DRAFT_75078 [Cryphonectria parasitica EP155]|uniref:Uncharacterized protein n=1 Tax=Cryphonectria parasitica (strain ATCC 38755 / EP155) TaxID=660469 RepID=A0A9P4Y0E2_CRYP1|nr:uncharacterized protein M406DRAFT_75078 [Cryphonectria parasitica EP155]KAF3763845.1 hypothetical protein M406DRAFT_75078 [Cryphonectria parasitica EP155]
MGTSLKRKLTRDCHDGGDAKRVQVDKEADRDASSSEAIPIPTPVTIAQTPAGNLTLTRLPAEIQLQIYDEALRSLCKPRIVQLDIQTVPCFDQTRRHLGVTRSWELTVPNRAYLHLENAREMARTLLPLSTSGRHTAEQFLRTHEVLETPSRCRAMLGLDLSLVSDVFWLPHDLCDFATVRKRYAPAWKGQDAVDEGRVRRVMMSLETLELELAWARGDIGQLDLVATAVAGRTEEGEAEANSIMQSVTPLQDILLRYYPLCDEVVVLVGLQGRPHVSWDDLYYVPEQEVNAVLGGFEIVRGVL